MSGFCALASSTLSTDLDRGAWGRLLPGRCSLLSLFWLMAFSSFLTRLGVTLGGFLDRRGHVRRRYELKIRSSHKIETLEAVVAYDDPFAINGFGASQPPVLLVYLSVSFPSTPGSPVTVHDCVERNCCLGLLPTVIPLPNFTPAWQDRFLRRPTRFECLNSGLNSRATGAYTD